MDILKQFGEIDRLKIVESDLKSARIRGTKHCVRCGFCCHMRTCIPTPNELKKIAKFLKMSVKKCINKFYVIDTQDYIIYYVKPAGINIKDLIGKFIPSPRTFNEGDCIFLKRKNNISSCKIYPIRPLLAKDAKCWADNEKDNLKSVIKTWKNEILEKEFNIIVKENEEG